ncbi:unnamed protein product [Acanthosepion pharaonis]|uniref:Uncharacterized protein n=1 Tax=Acanthosepion pharaonis TaxID=158019 RepID=A0A812CSD6_ACAPH|nr:unnamed protein product [Sepia pharaonis]
MSRIFLPFCIHYSMSLRFFLCISLFSMSKILPLYIFVFTSCVILFLCISYLLMSCDSFHSVSLCLNVLCDSSLCLLYSSLYLLSSMSRVILPSVSLVCISCFFPSVSLVNVRVILPLCNVPCDSSLCISCLQCPVILPSVSLVFNVPCDSSPLYLLSSLSRVILPSVSCLQCRVILPSVYLVFTVPLFFLCISCLQCPVILPSVSLVFNVPCDSSLCISCLQCPVCDSSLCISCLQCPV